MKKTRPPSIDIDSVYSNWAEKQIVAEVTFISCANTSFTVCVREYVRGAMHRTHPTCVFTF